MRVAAIGPGTASALARRGVRADLVPERFVAESLLEAFPDPGTPGARVLLARAEVARDVLPEGSPARGYAVDVLAVYRTVTAAPDAADLARVRAGEVDAVTFTSSSTVTNFCDAVGALPDPQPLVVSIGPVTSADRPRARARASTPRPIRTRSTASSPRCSHVCTTGLRSRSTQTRVASAVSFPERRLRRLRRTPALRRLVAEHRARRRRPRRAAVREGGHRRARAGRVDARRRAAHAGEPAQGGARRSPTSASRASCCSASPPHKDARGSQADAPDGVVQVALRNLRDEVGDALVLMADDCLDEYTDHGHCGILTDDGEVDNDATLERYASIAVAQADAGADVDRAVRDDGRPGRRDPRRARRAPATPTRRSSPTRRSTRPRSTGRSATRPSARRSSATARGYQMDAANGREALAEVALDIDEGADMVMVKPALAYLDVIADVRDRVRRAGRGVPRERRVRDGEGRRATRLDRRHRGRARAPARDQARRRRHRPHVLRPRGRRAASRPASLMTDRGSRAAQARIPGGVNSPVRAFGAVGGEPFFVARAHGACLVDTDGSEYLDYVQSWGASILGHAASGGRRRGAARRGRRHVVRRADARARSSSPRRSATGLPSVEKVRLVSSGTEAAMTAVRLARGATGRAEDREVRGLLPRPPRRAARAGRQRRRDARAARFGRASRRAPSPTRSSCPYNDLAALDAALAEHGAELAAILVEPIAANMGLVPPRRRLPRRPARALHAHGALLVFDEVITGFRVGLGGAQGRFGITPDLSIFGKVVGGGLPLAAVGGPAALMDELAPLGPVYQAGTLSGNPLATAAGLAVLAQLDDGCVRRARSNGRSASPTACATRSPTPASPRRSPARSRSSACSSRRRRCATTTTRKPADHARYAQRLPRPARPRRVLRAERLRDAVPEPRPHRRRHRRKRSRPQQMPRRVGLTLDRRALRLVAVALFAPAADAVHVEQRAGEQEHHDREREERGAAVLARVDELLRDESSSSPSSVGTGTQVDSAFLRSRASFSYQCRPSRKSPNSNSDVKK